MRGTQQKNNEISRDTEVKEMNKFHPLLQKISSTLYQYYGIYYSQEKYYQLYHKILRRTRRLEIKTLNDYIDYLKQNDEEIHFFLDEVSTNKTEFFRENTHWEYLKKKLFPHWKKNVQTEQEPVKIWSVAVSSGQEAYTVAMILEDFFTTFGMNPAQCYKILATDLSRGILQKAVHAKYSEIEIRSVREYRPGYVPLYFHHGDTAFNRENGFYYLRDEIMKRVTFRQFNLKTDAYPFRETFDLILCRNVLIYFDRDMIQHVIQNIGRSLKTGGTLFIGHTENLQNINHELKKIQPAVYRKGGENI